MLVPEVLLQTADDIARFVKAVRRVQVGTLALCKFADQNGLLLITCVRVDVFRLLRRVFIRRILSADQHARIAAFRIVDMLFLSAERLLRHCNRWKDQRMPIPHLFPLLCVFCYISYIINIQGRIR